MAQEKSISVVIPVFNEEKTVAKVVAAVLEWNRAREVICVDDGSSDKSQEILKEFGDKIKVINLEKNHGKGFAMAAGIEAAAGEVIIFTDSDILNLCEKHLNDLLDPILNSGFSAVIGVAANEKGRYKFPIDVFVSGQRAYLKEILLPYLSRIAKAGYGVEIFLNRLVSKKKKKFVALRGLIHVIKEKKWRASLVFRKKLEVARDVIKEMVKKDIFSKQ